MIHDTRNLLAWGSFRGPHPVMPGLTCAEQVKHDSPSRAAKRHGNCKGAPVNTQQRSQRQMYANEEHTHRMDKTSSVA